MKTYEEMAADVLKRRDEYEESRKQSESSLKTAVTVVLAGAFIVSAMIVGPIVGRLIKSPANQPSNTTDAVTLPAQKEEIKKDKELTFKFINSLAFSHSILRIVAGKAVDSDIDLTARVISNTRITKTDTYECFGRTFETKYYNDWIYPAYGFTITTYTIGEHYLNSKETATLSITDKGDFYRILGVPLYKIDINPDDSAETVLNVLKENEETKALGIDNYSECTKKAQKGGSGTFIFNFAEYSNGIKHSDSLEIRVHNDGYVFCVAKTPELNKEYNEQLYNNKNISVSDPESTLMKALKAELESIYNTDYTRLTGFDINDAHYAEYESKPAIYMSIKLYACYTVDENNPYSEKTVDGEEFMVLIDGLDPV